MKITEENWTYTRLTTGKYNVFLSIGGEFDSQNNYHEIYFINKYLEDNLVHQTKWTTLRDALSKIEEDFTHWQLVDLSIKDDDSGCSTCQAH